MKNAIKYMFLLPLLGQAALPIECTNLLAPSNQNKALQAASSAQMQQQSDTKANKETIETKVGRQFTIELPANASTGYSWYWLVNEPTKDIPFTLIKKEYAAKRSDMVGSDGIMTFIFKATRAGSATLMLYHKRLWEKNSDTDMRRYTVTIK